MPQYTIHRANSGAAPLLLGDYPDASSAIAAAVARGLRVEPIDVIESPSGAAFAHQFIWPAYQEPATISNPEPVTGTLGAHSCAVCGTDLSDRNVRFGPHDDETPYCARHVPVAECCECGATLNERGVHWHDDNAYCSSCLPRCIENYDGELSGYHDLNPTDLGWFTSKGVARRPEAKTRYFGIELEYEMDSDSDASDESRGVWRAFGQGRCIISTDGSLSHGLELVSAPADYATMHKWLSAFTPPSSCRPKRSCGMHVHVTRSTISPLTLGKVLVFVNHPEHHAFIETVARRAETSYCKKQPKGITSQWRGTDGVHDRYQAVNTTNPHTIEFRLFASTRKGWKAAAALESVQAILSFCEGASLRELRVANFLTWLVKNQSQYKEFVKLLDREGYADHFRKPRAKREPVNVTVTL